MKKIERVLAIETSCDDTSVSIVEQDRSVRSLCMASQEKVHAPFGGVVPEIASRNHTLYLLPLVEKALDKAGMSWDDIDGIAVTNRPGLIGALLVGLVTAKTLALAKNKPFIGVNHLEGHIYAPFLQDEEYRPPAPKYPFIALAVSGGHTSLYRVDSFASYKLLGQTIDDAAGEAFDKFAKMLGLGYPGGVKVDANAKKGNTEAYELPRALMKEDNLNFSFSGLKTSAQRLINSLDKVEEKIEDLCASYQQAIVDALLGKLKKAVEKEGAKTVVITGGVSANSGLREQGMAWAKEAGIELLIPPLRYCTDNAAMIGLAGIYRFQNGEESDQGLSPSPRPWPGDFINS